MKMEINEVNKIVKIWLTNDEHSNKEQMDNLKPLYKDFKEKGYRTVVMKSGGSDLLLQTQALLLHNKNLG